MLIAAVKSFCINLLNFFAQFQFDTSSSTSFLIEFKRRFPFLADGMLPELYALWFMPVLYDAAAEGNLERVMLFVEAGMDKNQVGGVFRASALLIAATKGHLSIVQYLVEQRADINKADDNDFTPLFAASAHGHVDVVRYLLEQGADRDKVDFVDGATPLHAAVFHGHIEIAKLLMVYGSDLHVRNKWGENAIESTSNEELKQIIRDEPRRRMDAAPGKRAIHQDRHPNAATSVQKEEEHDSSHLKPRLEEGIAGEEDKIAEEDDDSEPSDGDDGH